MTSFSVCTSTAQEAEEVLAYLWLQAELHELKTPTVFVQFEGLDQVTFVVTTDSSTLADRVLSAWAVRCGGCASFIQPGITSGAQRPQANPVQIAMTSNIGPIDLTEPDMPVWKRAPDTTQSGSTVSR